MKVVGEKKEHFEEAASASVPTVVARKQSAASAPVGRRREVQRFLRFLRERVPWGKVNSSCVCGRRGI